MLNVFSVFKVYKPIFGCISFLFTQTNEEQQVKIEELQDKLDKVLTITFTVPQKWLYLSLFCSLFCYCILQTVKQGFFQGFSYSVTISLRQWKRVLRPQSSCRMFVRLKNALSGMLHDFRPERIPLTAYADACVRQRLDMKICCLTEWANIKKYL